MQRLLVLLVYCSRSLSWISHRWLLDIWRIVVSGASFKEDIAEIGSNILMVPGVKRATGQVAQQGRLAPPTWQRFDAQVAHGSEQHV